MLKKAFNLLLCMEEEPKNLLKQELREPAVYNSIIEAIAKGYTKLNEISTKIGEEKGKCSKYISSLQELHIVFKETPIMEKENSRKIIYRINDNLFKFYYNFIFSNKSLICMILMILINIAIFNDMKKLLFTIKIYCE